ncbi:TolC family protein [Spirochaeta africana]|uniref:Outer membrane protein n=1 Tax=Spirochaeta africana (strain ATCC 700263 / DSM 8902 / Z-7692) TaxID=889378 RepID=H9UH69_SPIAZ|nr:TolC family protein [Spirochaeta africana]AFG36862.1 hypothetical protein Spiaf_0767 [Spirochaeta africana DSM 8902]
MISRLVPAALLGCLVSLSVTGLENSLEQLLVGSQRLEETRLQREIARIGADEIGVDRLPELYLQAPSAYRIDIPPEGDHSWQAQLGVRQQLPFGIASDVSWQHGLRHRESEFIEATEFSDEEKIPGGFMHSLSAEAGLTVPLYVSRYWNLPSVQRTTAHDRAAAAHTRDRTRLIREFLADWFSLYRNYLEVKQARQHEVFALSAVELQEQLIERGERAVHTLWEYQRSAHEAERERIQREHAYDRATEQMHVRHGIEFPENPELPDSRFSWQYYGISPLYPTEHRVMQLDSKTEELSYQRSRQGSAPRLSLSFSLAGPTQETAGDIREGFTDQFGDWDDWSPSLSVGFSLSSRDVQSAARDSQRHRLSAHLTVLETSHRLQQHETDINHLITLRDNYARLYQRESEAVQNMQRYYSDVLQQHERGEIDTRTLQEIQLSLSDMQTALSLTESHLQETRLELELLAGGPIDR